MNLNNLIKKRGHPKILIDHWGNKNKGYACFKFNETLEWNNQGLFLNHKKINNECLSTVQKIIDSWKDNNNFSAIGFINYNFKNILYPHINFKNKSNNLPHLFFIKPDQMIEYNIENENYRKSSPLLLKDDLINTKLYSTKIDEIKNELSKGNAYQINYTMPKRYKVNDSSLNTYLYLRQIAKPCFGYYFKHKDFNILSSSPEQFIKKIKNKIFSYPMKGTRPRTKDHIQNKIFKNELRNSIKDKAEHLMIVDLIRNDIGKISKYGNVKVNNLFSIKSHETVYQMVSEVIGELDKNISEMEIIKALFPGGSVTGAPKESAMKIIDKLESYNRNLYTGSIGYIKNNGDMNFNVAIRTLTIQNNIATYPVGGGIVWDSNYHDEWKEAQLKSKILSPLKEPVVLE